MINGEPERAWRSEDFKHYLRLGADCVTKVEHERLKSGLIEGMLAEIEMRDEADQIIREMNGEV